MAKPNFFEVKRFKFIIFFLSLHPLFFPCFTGHLSMCHLRSDFCKWPENKKLPGSLYRACFSLETSRHVYTKLQRGDPAGSPAGETESKPWSWTEGRGSTSAGLSVDTGPPELAPGWSIWRWAADQEQTPQASLQREGAPEKRAVCVHAGPREWSCVIHPTPCLFKDPWPQAGGVWALTAKQRKDTLKQICHLEACC